LTLAVSCMGSFVSGAVGSLLDAIVVDQVPNNAYGRLRLWGAVGYGFAGGIVGIAMLYVKSDISWLPYVTHFAPGFFFGILAIIVMCFLEDTTPKIENVDRYFPSIQAPEINEETKLKMYGESDDGFIAKLKKVPRTLDMFLFIVIIFICGCFMGLVSTYLFLFIKNDLKGDEIVMGVSVLVSCLAEVPVFFFSEHLLNRVSADWVLLISLIAYIIRFNVYWILAVSEWSAWYILIPEVLHGFTYALMWSAAVAKATKSLEGLNLTSFAVGFITSVLTSGNIVGALGVGVLLKHGVGYLWIWQGATYLMVGIVCLWVFKLIMDYFFFEEEEKPVPEPVESETESV